MVNHHEQPSFGRIVLEHFPSILNKSKCLIYWLDLVYLAIVLVSFCWLASEFV